MRLAGSADCSTLDSSELPKVEFLVPESSSLMVLREFLGPSWSSSLIKNHRLDSLQ